MTIAELLSIIAGLILIGIIPLQIYRWNRIREYQHMFSILMVKMAINEIDEKILNEFIDRWKALRRTFLTSAIVLLLFTGLIVASSAAEYMQYESRHIGVFDILHPDDGRTIGTGKFELVSEGPLTNKNPVKLSWIYFRPYEYWIEGISINLVDERGVGEIGINIPEDTWEGIDQYHPLYIHLEDWTDFSHGSNEFSFNFQGIETFDIVYLINITDSVNTQYMKRQDVISSEFIVGSQADWSNYQNNQIQVASLVFGVIIISIPVFFKTMLDIYEKLTKNDVLEKKLYELKKK